MAVLDKGPSTIRQSEVHGHVSFPLLGRWMQFQPSVGSRPISNHNEWNGAMLFVGKEQSLFRINSRMNDLKTPRPLSSALEWLCYPLLIKI
jgi:hypothetical protein